MNVRLVVRPEGEAELVAARDWYDARRAGLGQDFVDEVAATSAAIAMRPLSFPKVHGEMRRAILRRFPYGVFFRATPEEAIILGIVHGRRHPREWRSRR